MTCPHTHLSLRLPAFATTFRRVLNGLFLRIGRRLYRIPFRMRRIFNRRLIRRRGNPLRRWLARRALGVT
jgi:hypothetical protein